MHQKRNHVVWIAMLISAAGLVTYFTVFARFAPLRDFPWFNLPMVGIGFALAVFGFVRRQNIWSAVGLLFSLLCTGLLVYYVFVLSSQLPSTEGVVDIGGNAPEFALENTEGAIVNLHDFAGKKLVVVFYRGFW